MKDDLKKIAEKEFNSILESLEKKESSKEALPKTMKELCAELNLFYRRNTLSLPQFVIILEVYLEELKEIY